MVDKLIRNGKVAVVVSPGFGAGWSTWSHSNDGHDREVLMFDKEIAEAVLAKDYDLATEIAERKCKDDPYLSSYGLTVVWVKQGEKFYIREYDGSESLIILNAQTYYVA